MNQPRVYTCPHPEWECNLVQPLWRAAWRSLKNRLTTQQPHRWARTPRKPDLKEHVHPSVQQAGLPTTGKRSRRRFEEGDFAGGDRGVHRMSQRTRAGRQRTLCLPILGTSLWLQTPGALQQHWLCAQTFSPQEGHGHWLLSLWSLRKGELATRAFPGPES